MSNSYGVGAARHVRRAAALLGLLVAGSVAVGVAGVPTSSAAEPVPTMTFTGTVNVLGLLNSLNVSPSSVSVPADGKVKFANNSPGNLQLTVGGRQFAFPSKSSQTLVFPGAASAQQVKAQAAPVSGAVGGLLASAGTVNVAAAPKSAEPAPQQPAPQQPAPQAPAQGGSNSGGTPNAPGAPAQQQPANGAVVPQALPGGGVQLPPNFGRDPVARGGMASAGLPPVTEAEAGMANEGSNSSSTGSENADSPANSATRALSGVRSVGGGIGLLILVATVLLGGVGAAAIRTVLAQRGAELRV